MRIINVIEYINDTIGSVESFPIFEEQLSRTVVDQAENLFMKLAKQNGYKDDENSMEIFDILDNGYWEDGNGYAVYLVWSNVNL